MLKVMYAAFLRNTEQDKTIEQEEQKTDTANWYIT